MKNLRKGFTLVELLIVIGVIGILGAMGMVSGTEATNIANATKIVEEFKVISAAMNMYYADNKATCEAGVTGSTILDGIKPYMKSVSSIVAGGTHSAGKYMINVTNGQWWLAYKLQETNSKVGQILANKAEQEGFKASASNTAGTDDDPTTNPYVATGDTVYMQVR